jgi:GNAT superfamily N-acetyltransferase
MSKTTAESGRTIERALEVFAKGYAFTRSLAFPCAGERSGKLWVIRDGPRKKTADYRGEEWVAHGITAEEADANARAGARSSFCICAILGAGESDEGMRAAYRAFRYRLLRTEPLMIHRLKTLPRVATPLPIARVDNCALADAVRKSARRAQALPEHFGDHSPLRLYAATDGERAAGWVRSIPVGDAAWVSSMHVLPAYRRRGIGKALLAQMLADDHRHGIKQSVLLSTHAGAMLYPHVGYEQIGTLYLFKPGKGR